MRQFLRALLECNLDESVGILDDILAGYPSSSMIKIGEDSGILYQKGDSALCVIVKNNRAYLYEVDFKERNSK